MGVEIERKFLVEGDFRPEVKESVHITQGYLCTDTGRTVRIRIRGDKGFITIKGASEGISRFEWEKEIPIEDARKMMEMCGKVIDKTRHLIPAGERTFEVDEFHGENEGLIMAEIELEREDEEFIRPEWLGEEVSYDRRYYNSQLLAHPYREWGGNAGNR